MIGTASGGLTAKDVARLPTAERGKLAYVCADGILYVVPKLTSTNRDAMEFGAILRRLRLARGWSLITAAQRSGMNPNYLGSLEKGGNMPSLATLLEMADVYGVAAADMVREVEEARRATRSQHAAEAAKTIPER